jgi:hypothetical protein
VGSKLGPHLYDDSSYVPKPLPLSLPYTLDKEEIFQHTKFILLGVRIYHPFLQTPEKCIYVNLY